MATRIEWERFAQVAKDASCPRDQIENFIAGGYIPQPKQLEFHALARQADAPAVYDEIGMGGARGGAKSHAIMAQLILDDCIRYPGIKGLFLRKIGKAAKESFEDLITKVCPQYFKYYQPGNSRLLLPNGSRVVLGGFNAEKDVANYLGIEYDAIAIEECTLLSKETYDKLRGSRRSSKDGWRERMYVSTNPGGIGHAWFKARFIEPARKGVQDITAFVFADYHDNRYLSDSYIRYLEGLTGWLGRAWREGDWDIAAGQFFTTFNADVHVKDFDSYASPYWTWWVSLDYGYQHYTTAYLFAKDGDGHVYVWGEHARRRWLVKSHSDALHAMVKRSPARVIRTFVAGADIFAKRGDEATIAEQYSGYNWNVEAAQMDRVNGAAEILKRLGDPAQGIAPTITIHPRCVGLIKSLPEMQHDPRRPEDVLKVDCDEEGNGGDDYYDGFRYGLMEAEEKYGPPEAQRYA